MPKLISSPKFYVYTYTDVRPSKEGVVFYVGKGTYLDRSKFRRMEKHWREPGVKNKLFLNVLTKIRGLGLEPLRQVVSWHDLEADAFAAEMALIAKHGTRLKGGTLCNLTDGGEGPYGYKHTDADNAKSAAASKAMWEREGFRELWVARAKERMADPEFRAEMQAIAFELWKDPAHRAKMLTPEISAIKSQTARKNWKDPDYVARRTAAAKAAMATPEAKARKSAASVKRWEDPEFKAKTSAAIREAVTTPEHRAKVSEINKALWTVDGVKEAFSVRMKDVLNNPEEKARKSAKAKAMWQDPEFRAKMDAAREKRYALNPPKAKPPKLTKEEINKKRGDGIRAAAARRTPEERARIAAGLSERTTAFAAKRKAEQIAAGLRQPDLTPEERAARRSASMKAAWQKPEMRAKHSANLKATLARPEVKAKKSASASAKWDDTAKAAERAKWTPERRAAQSAKMKAALAKLPPEFKAKKAQEMRDRNSDPEYKAKLAAVNKARRENPTEREAQSTRMKAAFDNPQDKVRRGAATAELWKDPAYREKMANRPTRKPT